MATQQVVIPETIKHFVDLVSERWGYYFGKRAIQSELMKATKVERATVRSFGEKIHSKISEYMENGTDIREEVRSLQGELAKARTVLKTKSTPFYEKIRPLNKALSFLDRTSIPEAIELVTGEKIVPRFQLSDYVLKALAPKK